jgi:hypothetical protein
MNNKTLKVFSGKCCKCDIGIPVNHADFYGKELHTGDIVLISSGEYLGTDLEQWTPTKGLTCVIATQFQSFSDGSVHLSTDDPTPFVMGIKGCGFDDPKWRIQIVKKFSDAIPGEHWPEYGFSFNYSEAADAAKV